jgi:hypothetical protein
MPRKTHPGERERFARVKLSSKMRVYLGDMKVDEGREIEEKYQRD